MQSPRANDDADRTNRFLQSGADTPHALSLRERAASQPPRTTPAQSYLASPSLQSMRSSSGGGPGAWPRFSSGLNPNQSLALPSSVPTRSASFSVASSGGGGGGGPAGQALFSSAMRDSRFASTFEDDESEALSDVYDPYEDRFVSPSLHQAAIGSGRGRSYAADMTRSRSQSVVTTRPGAIGNPFTNVWGESGYPSSDSHPLNIPGSRYGDLKPPGSSRYGSLGALGRSPSGGYSQGVGSFPDHTNMSPFVRDLQSIMQEEREAWEENGGGGSGTTTRRHSVSVSVPARRPVVGFNAPGTDTEEPVRPRPGVFQSVFPNTGAGGGLLLTDDDLASDLGMLNLGSGYKSDINHSALSPPTPSSLPSGSLSRSPPSLDRLSPYQPLQLNIPGSYAARQGLGSPSDSGFSAGSPSRHQLENDVHIGSRDAVARAVLTARFVPGQGIQQIPESAVLPTPITPGGVRSGPHYAAQGMGRRSSDASKSIADLGKGVPLHSVPMSWPLFIVEFKAGRTDLFYCTDLSSDIRVGDLVIVEADRGKDLGKVVNDTITLAEVEAFQKQQKLLSGYAEAQGQVPTSPTGSTKEINPKMIYNKATLQDTQSLNIKLQDEAKALELCRSKVRQRKLPMEVIDAEYQWDRRKLTFYFVADKRIDFRELVRELFRLYKTRIWMASLGGASHEQ